MTHIQKNKTYSTTKQIKSRNGTILLTSMRLIYQTSWAIFQRNLQTQSVHFYSVIIKRLKLKSKKTSKSPNNNSLKSTLKKSTLKRKKSQSNQKQFKTLKSQNNASNNKHFQFQTKKQHRYKKQLTKKKAITL